MCLLLTFYKKKYRNVASTSFLCIKIYINTILVRNYTLNILVLAIFSGRHRDTLVDLAIVLFY